jgi:protein-tyrosine phosphatase
MRVLQEHGYDDGTRHRAREFRRKWFSGMDLIVAANKGHRDLRGRAPDDPSSAKVRPLREFDQTAVESGTLEVDDPYLGNAAGFDHCLTVVERACRGVGERLGPELPEPADNRS